MCVETPVDLAAVQADDVLLDGLSGAVAVTDEELARVLHAWRREIADVPVPPLVSVGAAVRVIAKARRRSRWAWLTRMWRF